MKNRLLICVMAIVMFACHICDGPEPDIDLSVSRWSSGVYEGKQDVFMITTDTTAFEIVMTEDFKVIGPMIKYKIVKSGNLIIFNNVGQTNMPEKWNGLTLIGGVKNNTLIVGSRTFKLAPFK